MFLTNILPEKWDKPSDLNQQQNSSAITHLERYFYLLMWLTTSALFLVWSYVSLYNCTSSQSRIHPCLGIWFGFECQMGCGGGNWGGKISQILAERIMQRLGTTEILKVFSFIEDHRGDKLSLAVSFLLDTLHWGSSIFDHRHHTFCITCRSKRLLISLPPRCEEINLKTFSRTTWFHLK